jgi:hypothetical protein
MSGDPAPGARYVTYQNEIIDDIRSTVEGMGCQPILFVGSGLSRRYFNAPNWDELLAHLADVCPNIDKGLGFYKQSLVNAPDIGERFAELYQEWAWGDGRAHFPEGLFEQGVGAQAYIKNEIARYISAITPNSIENLKSRGYREEIESLQEIRPHAIITTNYDKMMETIFPDHFPVIGQNILSSVNFSIGELFKIHGSVDDANSIVFTRTDYDVFQLKKKYLSAKLLTFFSEHPLIFLGYSASDPNIKSILSDIDEALPLRGGTIPNVYILEHTADVSGQSSPPRDKVISTGEDKTVRVKMIQAKDFTWVFDAFAANPALNDVNPRVLRALLARSYNLVRHDIPKMTVDANFEMLSGAVESDESFATLFGLAHVSDFSAAAASHPYALTEVGVALGGKGWHLADKLLKSVKKDKGIDIKESDNMYHIAHRVNKTVFGKYSADMIALLEKVRDGSAYDVEL